MQSTIKTWSINLKKNIIVIDDKNNKVETEYAEYYEKKQLLTTKGETRVNTTDNYILNGEDITVDNENKSIISNKSSILIDNDGNEIFLEILNTYMGKIYLNLLGKLRLMIKNENVYQFSQIYIDTKKRNSSTDTKHFLI